jgi:membrane protease YdiL (CAAX protease family)
VIGDVKPWGRWATLGLGLIALLAGQLAGLAVAASWFGVSLASLSNLANDGVAAILIICISTPVQVLLLTLMARRKGASAVYYLGLTLPRKSHVVVGVIAVLIFILVVDGISWLLGRNLVSPFQLDIYRTASAAGYLPWLWLTVAVVAPISEETLFRGFLFRGWHRASPDAWPAIIMTALLWALIHLQYDLYYIAQVFAYGLVLGWFRWVTGSTILTMLLHGIINCEGMVETFIAIHD